MQDKEFEKYLQEHANKFWLEPHPGSFGRVMEALQREKKRRRYLFFMFFSLFGLSVCCGLLWWFIGVPFTVIETAQADKTVIENEELLARNSLGSIHSKPLSAEVEASITNGLSDNSQTVNVSENKMGLQTGAINHKNEISHAKWGLYHGRTKSSVKGKEKTKDIESPSSVVREDKTDNIISPGEDKTLEPTAEQEKERSLTTHVETTFIATDSTSKQIGTNIERITQEVSQLVEPPVVVNDTPKVRSRNRFLDPNRTKKWMISGWFNGFAAGSRFEANPNFWDKNSNLPKDYANYRNYYNTLRFGFSAGGSVGFTPIKYLTIELGLQYTEFTSLEKPEGYSSQLNDSLGPVDPFPFYVSTYNEWQVYSSNFKMLQIPLLFTFNWGWGKSAIHVTAGPIFSYATAFKGYELSNKFNSLIYNSELDHSRIERLGIGLQSKLLYSYQILPNFSLYMGPAFQYRFNSVFDNSYMIRQNPYFIGLETGLRVHF